MPSISEPEKEDNTASSGNHTPDHITFTTTKQAQIKSSIKDQTKSFNMTVAYKGGVRPGDNRTQRFMKEQ
jgi:hypothetical protein